MESGTSEFSFILKPSKHGMGVFAAHDTKAGAHVRLFGDEALVEDHTRVIRMDSVPARSYPQHTSCMYLASGTATV